MNFLRKTKDALIFLGLCKVGELSYRFGNTFYSYKFLPENPLESNVETKVACITGAGNGFGRTFSRELASKGFKLLLVDDNSSEFKLLVKELLESYPNLDLESVIFNFSTSEIEEYEKLIGKIESNKTSLLINCVEPSLKRIKFGSDEYEEFQKDFAKASYPIPLLSLGFLYEKAGAKNLEMKKFLINVGSNLGEAAIPFLATASSGYSLTNYLSKSLDLDKPKNAHVLLVTPESKEICTKCGLFGKLYSSNEDHNKEVVRNSFQVLGKRSWIAGTLYDELRLWIYRSNERKIGKKNFVDGVIEMYHNQN